MKIHNLADISTSTQHQLEKRSIMEKTVLSTSGAPAAIGPYSQGIKAGNMVYLSGQLGLDSDTGELKEGVEAQTAQAFVNISAVLESIGLELGNIVKTTVFLKNMNDFTAMNDIYAKSLKKPFPARSTIEVARLPKDALVEIEVIAMTCQ